MWQGLCHTWREEKNGTVVRCINSLSKLGVHCIYCTHHGVFLNEQKQDELFGDSGPRGESALCGE
ncbi:hypothetical protein FKM82_004362 [Ascaphus truei]